MQSAMRLTTRSGYGVLYDPAALAGTPARWDLELLQTNASQGSLAFWPSIDDECVVLVLDDQLPGELRRVAHLHDRTTLRIRSGHLRLADAAELDQARTPDRHAPRPREVTVEVAPATYAATVWLLDWSDREYDEALRRSVGGTAIAARDAIAWLAMIVGVLTVIGMPIFLIGRVLDAGLAGLLQAATLSGAVLVPLWIAVLVGLRLPIVRRTDRADAAIELAHPDVVIQLDALA